MLWARKEIIFGDKYYVQVMARKAQRSTDSRKVQA